MKIEGEEDYKEFDHELRCPSCNAECEDYQQDSQEPYKEEYCGNCDTQFGYEEAFIYEEDPDVDAWTEDSVVGKKVRMYWTHELH